MVTTLADELKAVIVDHTMGLSKKLTDSLAIVVLAPITY
jgi:hypothetical protein